MTLCLSAADAKAIAVNKEIERQISEDRKEFNLTFSCLIMGNEGSGKTRLMKQLSSLQNNEGQYTKRELTEKRYIILGTTIRQMRILITALEEHKVQVNPENNIRMGRIIETPATGESWNNEVGEDIIALWADQSIRDFLQHISKHSLYSFASNSVYLFDNSARFNEPNYLPTTEDINHLNKTSNGIQEINLQVDGATIRVLDMSGQKGEKRKWIYYFDQMTVVVFCVGISCYDIEEHGRRNQLKESLTLFDELVNSQWFRHTAICLLFTKTDLFKLKIEHVDLKVCFPEYTGGCNFENASSFIKQKFLEKSKNNNQVIYPLFTSANSPEQVEFIFKCIRTVVSHSA